MILQICICLVIYFIFYLLQNGEYLFSEEVLKKTKEMLTQDLNFEGIIQRINEFFTEEPKEGKTTVTEDAIGGAGGEENIVEENTVTVEEVKEIQYEQETGSFNQMKEDATYVKEQISMINPLLGTITSRFGLRNPTTESVPKYHTGIDIAANTGTVIIAAMDGTVELASSEGDYGNHLKIVNGEIMTLYAHCHTLYVKQGEEIKQGQQIAEVGATGNVTGAHLHFEVRRNNRYINPEYILEF